MRRVTPAPPRPALPPESAALPPGEELPLLLLLLWLARYKASSCREGPGRLLTERLEKAQHSAAQYGTAHTAQRTQHSSSCCAAQWLEWSRACRASMKMQWFWLCHAMAYCQKLLVHHTPCLLGLAALTFVAARSAEGKLDSQLLPRWATCTAHEQRNQV